MVTFTANKALGLPAVGGDVGVWGPPLNNNSSAIDQSFGGSVTIPISSVAGAITLLASNYVNVFITFTGALSQNTAVTFPSIGSFYTIQNLTTNASQFTVVIGTTAAASAQIIGLPPNQPQDVMTDGVNTKYRGLPHIGAYWDYAGATVPNWVTVCTVKPWLNCDGTAFSSATYPYLSIILGGTTLPDSRGSARAALNQGSGRITSGISGVDGNTILARGGNESMQSHTHAFAGNALPPHAHTVPGIAQLGGGGGGGVWVSGGNTATTADSAGTPSGNNAASGAGNSQNLPPTYIGGLTLVRAG